MLGRTLHLHTLSGTDSVWAVPVSLAATNGISIDFSSCWYSDVSFPSVCAPFGAPKRLRNFVGLFSIRVSLYRRLHASPQSLSRLATPFVAPQAKPFTIWRSCVE